MCPSTALAGADGIVDKIKEVLCKLVEDHDANVEEKVCAAVNEKYPEIPVDQCEIIIRFGFGELKQMCPSTALAGPDGIVDKIKEVLCKLVEDHEANVEEKVCAAVNEKYPEIPVDQCEIIIRFGFGELKQM